MDKKELIKIFNEMKSKYNEDKNPSYENRKEILNKLKQSIIDNESNISEALNKDYGYRSEFDTLISDVLSSVSAVNYSLKNLKKWMKPKKRHAGLLVLPSKVEIHYQPLGVVGIITPWNFPLFLALSPAIQALAAGNKVMIKMSEFTPNINKVVKKIVEPISEHIAIIEGEAETGAAFSEIPFDHLIFTGSTTVGKLVAQSAAKNLTPVTLELGGKSPVIIDDNISMDIAVDSILLGKTINSGQICVAPDYLFVPKQRKEDFINVFLNKYKEYYCNDKKKNKLTNIISERQYERLMNLLNDAKEKGAIIHSVKEIEQNSRQVFGQIVDNVNDDMGIMKEEIFGSLLPIMTYENIEEAISYINERPRPLALYLMSDNLELVEKVIYNTHSGGVAINDTLMHVVADDAPFGGIGDSGIGHYHGVEGFLTFSKTKTVLKSTSKIQKNKIILKNRDFIVKIMKRFFLK